MCAYAYMRIRTNVFAGLRNAAGKLLCLSESHKGLLVVEVSVRSQWKIVAPTTAQVIIPDLNLGLHFLPHSQKLLADSYFIFFNH